MSCLAATTGALGPFIWTKASAYLVVPTSVFGMALLPIAYLSFWILINQRSLMGDNRPTGGRRIAWNTAMAVAAITATCASLFVIHKKGAMVLPFLDAKVHVGYWFVALLTLGVIVTHFLKRRRPS